MQITKHVTQLKRIIQQAKERAYFGFSAMVQHMVSDADSNIVKAQASAKSGVERTTLGAARQFLRQDGNEFMKRLETFFHDYLDRAMQTMYTDLRSGMREVSAEHLSLIDDETMNQQIEVDRLLQRMRDADRESLGRLNIIIAQLHGDHDVRERENPFRPYLLARSLYDVLGGMVRDEALSKVLFDHLANAMIVQLPVYYRSIREVFESSGVHGKLVARPSMLSRMEREMLARRAAGVFPSNNPVNAASAPSFENISLSLPPEEGEPTKGFQDFVRQIFNLPESAGRMRNPRSAEAAPPVRPLLDDEPEGEYEALAHERRGSADKKPVASASATLLSKLNEYQQKALRGEPANDKLTAGQNQLFALREELGDSQATSQECVVVEVVALLFEFILQDEQIPADLREKIGRLQVPFLKAAMLSPDVLQQADHPAKQLLNRMGSVAVGLDGATAMGLKVGMEITRVVGKILAEFDDDMTVFKTCLGEFDSFIELELRDADANAVLRQAALEEAEKISIILNNLTNMLGSLLPANMDVRVSEFIMQIWTRVLAYAVFRDHAGNVPTVHGGAMHLPHFEILPELVWSVQARPTPQERSILMRFLPALVKRLKTGLKSIPLPEEQYHQALDQLVSVHTEVLRAAQPVDGDLPPSLAELHEHFSALVIDKDISAWVPGVILKVPQDVIEAALSERKVTADLMIDSEDIAVFESDADMLLSMQVGSRAECWYDGAFQLARVSGISAHRLLFLFKLDDEPRPIIYCPTALIKGLREGSIKLLESTPLFERALESLMMEAEDET